MARTYTTEFGSATVETYVQRWRSGHTKTATRVVFADGTDVKFMDRIPARMAIPQAVAVRGAS